MFDRTNDFLIYETTGRVDGVPDTIIQYIFTNYEGCYQIKYFSKVDRVTLFKLSAPCLSLRSPFSIGEYYIEPS